MPHNAFGEQDAIGGDGNTETTLLGDDDHADYVRSKGMSMSEVYDSEAYKPLSL